MAEDERDADETRRARHERLLSVYKILSDLLMTDDERFTDSLNIFVVLQAIIFAGYIQLDALDQNLVAHSRILSLLKYALPFIGAMLCLNALYAFHRRVSAMKFWRKMIYKVEHDEDFICGQYGRELDIYTSRKRYLDKKHADYPKFILRILKYQRYFIAALFFSVWILILIYQIIS